MNQEIKKAKVESSDPPNEEITKISLNFPYLKKIYMNRDISDVILIVKGKEFPVMRVILSMQSTFFEVLFNGNFEETKGKKVTLNEIELKPFEILLHHMYFGEINIDTKDCLELIELLKMAHFFGLRNAMLIIADLLEALPRDVATVIETFNQATFFQMKKLQQVFIDYILFNLYDFIKLEVFTKLSGAALILMLDNNNWSVSELEIAEIVVGWIKKNLVSNPKEYLQKIRLTLIPTKILATHIRDMNVFTDEQILNAIAKREREEIEPYRYHPGGLTYFSFKKASPSSWELSFSERTIGRIVILSPIKSKFSNYFSIKICHSDLILKSYTIFLVDRLETTFPPMEANKITIAKNSQNVIPFSSEHFQIC